MNIPEDSVCVNWAAFPLTGETPPGGVFTGPGVTAGNFDPAAAGAGMQIIIYTYTDSNGCDGIAADSIYVDPCTGIGNYSNQNSISVFPNPFNNTLIIKNEFSDSGELKLFNVLGEVVYSRKTNSSLTTIDTKKLRSGIYFLQFKSEKGAVTKKIIKE